MAEGIATRSSRGHRTICLPVSEDAYFKPLTTPPSSGPAGRLLPQGGPNCSRRTSPKGTN